MSSSRVHDLLQDGLNKLKIQCPEATIFSLNVYIDEIILWNAAYKLVAAVDRKELIIRHVLDSLAPLIYIKQSVMDAPLPVNLADAGSGNGLPGIPVSLCLPDMPMTLIERSGRRAGFLRNAVVMAGKPEITIAEQDIREVSDLFSVVMFRAFRPLPDIFRELSRITKPGGTLFAYKGKAVSLAEELDAVPSGWLKGWQVAVHSIEVPFLDAERHVCVLKKPGEISKTGIS